MRLSEKAIKEFREIYFREYGKSISDDEAQEIGQRLISLFRIIYRPIPGKDIPLKDGDCAPKKP
jgi:hypothetical protein